MQTKQKNRALLIYKYLMEQSDEAHPKSTREIQAYLSGLGVAAGRKTIAADMEQLLEAGYDVVCSRSRQNQYFIGARAFELAELKLLVDAVQAARFISQHRSAQLIEKLTALASPYEAEALHRQLYVEGRVKTGNEQVFYAVDMLYTALREGRQVTFQYREYAPDRSSVLKHNGQWYFLSPYDLVWSCDSYYVCGWSESHGKVATFRVDRMHRLSLTDRPAAARPEHYDISALCRQAFLMYDAGAVTVKLRCRNDTMKAIIDRFGEQAKTRPCGKDHFIVEAAVSPGPTFFAWIFNYAGGLRILSPQSVADGYRAHLKQAMENA